MNTEDEKNGWKDKDLAEYQAERNRAAEKIIFRPKTLPIKQVGYSPHRWRR